MNGGSRTTRGRGTRALNEARFLNDVGRGRFEIQTSLIMAPGTDASTKPLRPGGAPRCAM